MKERMLIIVCLIVSFGVLVFLSIDSSSFDSQDFSDQNERVLEEWKTLYEEIVEKKMKIYVYPFFPHRKAGKFSSVKEFVKVCTTIHPNFSSLKKKKISLYMRRGKTWGTLIVHGSWCVTRSAIPPATLKILQKQISSLFLSGKTWTKGSFSKLISSILSREPSTLNCTKKLVPRGTTSLFSSPIAL